MSTGGYLDTRTTKPIGLGIVIAAHAAILTAIALAPPDIVQRVKIFDTKLIAIDPEKAPPPPPEKNQAKPDEQTVTRVTSLVTTPPTTMEPVFVPLTPPSFEPPVIAKVEPVKADPVFVSATADPRAQENFQPDYPTQLIRAGVEGFATVRVLIGSDGRVKTVENVNATDPAFFEATRRQALRFWRFRAATSDGTPVESWRTMTVRFRITN